MPFPVDSIFEFLLFESTLLQGTAPINMECQHGGLISKWTGALMYITVVSRIDLCYLCMHISGYMSCPNEPILNHAVSLPSSASSNYVSIQQNEEGQDALTTHWGKGQAEFLVL